MSRDRWLQTTQIAKYNENHDQHGRFATGSGGGPAATGPAPQGMAGTHKPTPIRPPSQSAGSLAQRVASSGGFTYQPATHDAPTKGFALSIYPEREMAITGQPTRAHIREYIAKNRDVWSKPDHYMGAWYDKESGKTYLDTSVIVQDQAKAVSLAQQHNQEGIYDLGAGQTIITKPQGERRLASSVDGAEMERWRGWKIARLRAGERPPATG